MKKMNKTDQEHVRSLLAEYYRLSEDRRKVFLDDRICPLIRRWSKIWLGSAYKAHKLKCVKQLRIPYLLRKGEFNVIARFCCDYAVEKWKPDKRYPLAQHFSRYIAWRFSHFIEDYYIPDSTVVEIDCHSDWTSLKVTRTDKEGNTHTDIYDGGDLEEKEYLKHIRQKIEGQGSPTAEWHIEIWKHNPTQEIFTKSHGIEEARTERVWKTLKEIIREKQEVEILEHQCKP